jgi:gliding motility-associated protein GldM
MSIPKEPRQLMINLMYLVLTALLALNVSAEVMNAFFSLDKGMGASRKIVEQSHNGIAKSINKQADAYKTPANAKYKASADKAVEVSSAFVDYIEGVRNELFTKAGGPSKTVPGQPKDIRNKDLTTRWFITEGKGKEVKDRIDAFRAELLSLAENDSTALSGISINTELPQNIKATNWEDSQFKQMPVAAIFPILGQYQSDAKSSTSAVLNYCLKKVSGEEEIRMDQFMPVISAAKGYVIKGDTYEAEVFLSAFSSTANNISINAGGQGLSVVGGKGIYKVGTSSPGTKDYTVNISVTNPVTKKATTYTKAFKYEVGERSASVALDKMNVFYIGVDNPITVSAAGVSSNDLKVSGSGVNLANSGGGKYVVTASSPGNASITLSGGGLPATKFDYRVKRIPDPVPMLGAKFKGGSSMGAGEFKAQGGLAAILENFDFQATCNIGGFTATYLAKRQDPVIKVNSGPRFGGEVADIQGRAKPGDTYFFDDIKAKCPGDGGSRDLGSIVIKIK